MNRVHKAFSLLLFSLLASATGAAEHEFHPPHKPGAGVSVESPEAIQLKAGQAELVVIHFHQQGTKTPVVVSLHSSQGIRFVEAPKAQWRFEAGEKLEVPLSIVADTDGRHSLMFQVSREMPNGKSIHSITGLTVQAGEKVSLQKANFPNGVQELPAKETIH